MDAIRILTTAKRAKDDHTFDFNVFMNMPREAVRAILWLLITNQVDTISLDQLEKHMEANAKVRATRL